MTIHLNALDRRRFLRGTGMALALPLLRDVEQRSVAIGRSRANSIDAWEQHFSLEVVSEYRRIAQTSG